MRDLPPFEEVQEENCKMSQPIEAFSRKPWASRGSGNQFPSSTPCPVLSGFLASQFEDQCSELSPLLKHQFPGSEDSGWMRSSFSIPATANDLTFPLFSLLSPFLEDVSWHVRLIYSFSQMLFLHVFNCILSPTIIINFFLSSFFSFCQ